MRTFHVNPGGWKEKYVLLNNIFKSSPAMLVGKMTHAVIEAFLLGVDIQDAQQSQLDWLDAQPDENIKWGKTGSRDKVRSDFSNACKMYFDECPKYQNIIAIEKKMEHSISDTID